MTRYERLNFREIIIPPRDIIYPIIKELKELRNKPDLPDKTKARERAARNQALEQLRQAEITYNAAEQAYRVAEVAYRQARQMYNEAVKRARAFDVGAINYLGALKIMPRGEKRK